MARRPGAARTAPARLDGVPVLIVDDNRDQPDDSGGDAARQWDANRWRWRTVRRRWRRSIRRDAAGCPFPLAILDFQMPGMDGFALAARIRAQAELRDTRLFMLTSAGQRGDAARCKDIGIESVPAEAGEAVGPARGHRPLAGAARGGGVLPLSRHSLGEPRPQAARTAGRGQRDQPEAGGAPAGEARAPGEGGQRRPGGVGARWRTASSTWF